MPHFVSQSGNAALRQCAGDLCPAIIHIERLRARVDVCVCAAALLIAVPSVEVCLRPSSSSQGFYIPAFRVSDYDPLYYWPLFASLDARFRIHFKFLAARLLSPKSTGAADFTRSLFLPSPFSFGRPYA
jgi:hypothetical protein